MWVAFIQTATRYFGPGTKTLKLPSWIKSILFSIGANLVRWMTFPVACVVGTCGYFLEEKYFGWNKNQRFEYLEKSRADQRMQRQMLEELSR